MLKYVNGKFDFGILYKKIKHSQLCSYIDSYFLGFFNDRKSTYGYVFKLGTSVVTWIDKKPHAMVKVTRICHKKKWAAT